MGGFVAVVPRRRPIHDSDIGRILEASERTSPDGIDHVVTPDGVLLVQCGFVNTPEAVGALGVRVDPTERHWLVKRGHINNYSELRERLRPFGHRPLCADADLMLAAHMAWGVDAASRVHGEYVFVAWDSIARTLTVARDHLGRRGCFVHDGTDHLIVASHPEQILAVRSVSRDIDEHGLVDELAATYVSRDRTLYSSIRRPWPATVTCYRDAGASVRRYWQPRACFDYDDKPASHYREAVADVVAQAVRRTMRAPGAVMCELSGGLDSSAIFGLAARMRRTDPALPGLYAMSLLYPGMECDESSYINSMLELWPTPWRGIPVVQPTAGQDGRSTSPLPSLAEQSLEWLRSAGARVILQGNGGDELFASGLLPITRPFRPTGHQLTYMWAVSGKSFEHLLLRARRELLRPRVPPRLIDLYLSVRGRDVERPEDDLLTPKARAIAGQLVQEAAAREGSPADARAMAEIWDPPTCAAAELDDAVRVAAGTETRQPFLDFDVINSVLQIPKMAHVADRRWRAVQKSAFAEVLSLEVRRRTDKAEFTSVRQHQDEQRLRMTGTASELVDRGLVRAEIVEAIRDHRGPRPVGSVANRRFWQLLTVIELDGWIHMQASR